MAQATEASQQTTTQSLTPTQDNSANPLGNDPGAQFKQNLFNALDTNGDGSITKGEVEKAVTNAGGTTEPRKD